MRSKILLLPLAAVALFGAGCFSRPAEPPPPPAQAPAPKTETPKASAPVVTGAPAATSTIEAPASAPTSTAALPPIDATWKTYTNAALGFSFQWPTRGRLAPLWEVKFLKADDKRISDDGCYFEDGLYRRVKDDLRLDVQGISFCHTRWHDGAAGSIWYTDDYVGKIRGTWVLIAFTKQFPSASQPAETDYVAFLDYTVGTLTVEAR